MTREHENKPASGPQSPARSQRRRRRLAVGTAGLAALLGPSAYVVTSEIVDESRQTTAQQVPVVAPVTTAQASAPPGGASGAMRPAAPEQTVEAAPSPLSSEVIKEILDARKKMADDGVDLKRPLQPSTTATADSVKAITEGSLNSGGIVRMVTAREDLTGQRELAWVSGGIKKYRDVPCSQTVRFSADSQPEKKDNLLICWRTSPTKSVISIVVDPEGKPSRTKAVNALKEEWRSME
ncbi:hypothetical protein [Actinoplanes derwentensis]|uniref:Uncharacterized protein n=1 Tax=Actinoplanes derwentensis TaxID=113562 RepID=A0A1H2D9E9_9ACTN|nr:hypothetical protein [Actinoplanes derwentensis]GID86395.1 hypothetical protein Ade03nite_53190 [Actinoplanes derwentensis]SDT79102.1 hypothetical protein SAMN04489716_8645 [Actinoplanes derwentensis]